MLCVVAAFVCMSAWLKNIVLVQILMRVVCKLKENAFMRQCVCKVEIGRAIKLNFAITW